MLYFRNWNFGNKLLEMNAESACDGLSSQNKIKATWKGPDSALRYNTEEELWSHLFTTKTQLLLENFTFFDKDGNIVPLNDEQMTKGNDNGSSKGIYFSGTVKPLYLIDEDENKSTFPSPYSTKVAPIKGGPIKEWWMTVGEEDQTNPLLGIKSELADYYLLTPSKTYQEIHEKQQHKIQSIMATNQVLHELAINDVPKIVEGQKHKKNVDFVNKLIRKLVLNIEPK